MAALVGRGHSASPGSGPITRFASLLVEVERALAAHGYPPLPPAGRYELTVFLGRFVFDLNIRASGVDAAQGEGKG